MKYDIFHLVQEVLKGDRPVTEGMDILNQYRKSMDGVESSRSSCVVRMFRHLNNLEKGLAQVSSVYDFASLLRQFIEMYHTRITISNILSEKLFPVLDGCGLYIDSYNEVDITDEWAEWLPEKSYLNPIYQLEQRRKQTKQIGDGILYGMTGYDSYTSKEQKTIIHASMHMNPGDTLLASLPTGGGKSLVGLLPAFFETKGGTLRGSLDAAGTTIVVVPTVSLAEDQCKAVKEFFSRVSDRSFMPQAYTQDMNTEQRSFLIQSLSEGTLPILFTSPEALMNGKLNEIIMQAAKKGFINRLVIDEAHIVVDWGNHFRTEFQLLSAWRKRLLEESKGHLKTVLLSATVTDWTAEILRELFSEPGHYTEIRSDQLRPEISFFLDISINEEKRYTKIINSIHFLPKPIILYVNTREHATEWRKRIIEKGYQSVEMFTGQITGENRKSLLEKWNRDEIDIMVATSAFGMGVDKKDIRTIIHCGMPESVNRFYQEVGRSGRDGFASLSILSFVPDDEKIAHGLVKKSIITTEKLIERWDRIFLKAQKTDLADEYWIQMDVQPYWLVGDQSGRRNKNWNESLLLLLYRHKFIDIKRVELDENGTRQLLIKVLDYKTINDPKLLYDAVNPYREQERKRINDELLLMRRLVTQGNSQCISTFFMDMYPYTERVCSGCPYCWKTSSGSTFVKQTISTPYQSRSNNHNKNEIVGPLSDYIWTNEVLLVGNDINQLITPEKIAELIQHFLKANISIFLLPLLNSEEKKKLVKLLPWKEVKHSYTILTHDEIEQSLLTGNQTEAITYFLEGHITIFYSDKERVNNHFYEWSKRYQQRQNDIVIVHIGTPDVLIKSQNRTLDNLVNVIPYDIDDYVRQQANSFDLKLL